MVPACGASSSGHRAAPPRNGPRRSLSCVSAPRADLLIPGAASHPTSSRFPDADLRFFADPEDAFVVDGLLGIDGLADLVIGFADGA